FLPLSLRLPPPPSPPLFPYTTLFRSLGGLCTLVQIGFALGVGVLLDTFLVRPFLVPAFILIVWKDGLAERPDDAPATIPLAPWRSEEHTSELQSLRHLVCRLLLEKKK